MNAVRQNVGYPTAIVVDNGLTTSSQNHAAYLVANSSMGHYETVGLPGYTGASPFDRIAAVGFPNIASEVTVAGDVRAFVSSLTAVQLIFDAPYHRMGMLEDYARMGIGGVTGNTWGAFNINFGNRTTDLRSSQVVAYPYAGQTGVPTKWYAYEDPDPFASAPQYTQTYTGYPVTIEGKLFSKLSSVNITITDGSGNAVLCQLQTPQNDSHLTSGAMCIPFTPLTASSAYTVHAVGVLTDPFEAGTPAHPIDLTWSFTTAPSSDGKAKAANYGVRPPVVQ
ncbi:MULTISPECIES: CAP domain-containing protein [unclassified Caballeronia]|uniref:CAP domain-containing protein n=1 Tax=unclassified Caballeronia TaxID=2646786 RepID=UPI002859104D|nr:MULTISPECIES: CAP domain-containing protein [unclassified Caballeronia]MDR5777135.1 CAP domain-containing protein [Caballeronia sp. LZ002]MDR5798709.1 CAP domain-containing protein [Caballeronia sp. LZ001]MDR5852532.1 CAP domain-containing protein [Caballeronia sp. LZ003]